jgi:hypothetical protein
MFHMDVKLGLALDRRMNVGFMWLKGVGGD